MRDDDRSAAVDEFRDLCASTDAAVSEAARFDLARVLSEQVAARPLAPEPVGRPNGTLVADARGRLAGQRRALEEARDELLVLVDAHPQDVGARVGLARVTEQLRAVVARDRQWAEVQQRDRAQSSARPPKGPLRPGPSSAPADAGTSSNRSTTADEGASRLPDPEAAPATGAPGAVTRSASQVLDRLVEVRAQQLEHDRRRAERALERSGPRRQ